MNNKILAIGICTLMLLVILTMGCFDDDEKGNEIEVTYSELMNDFDEEKLNFKSYNPGDEITIKDKILKVKSHTVITASSEDNKYNEAVFIWVESMKNIEDNESNFIFVIVDDDGDFNTLQSYLIEEENIIINCTIVNDVDRSEQGYPNAEKIEFNDINGHDEVYIANFLQESAPTLKYDINYFTLLGSEKTTSLSIFEPGSKQVNVVGVDNNEPLLFKRNVIGKDYDEEGNISLLLSMNSMEASGKIVHLEMLFDYDNDGSTDTTFFFDTYETKENFTVENVSFKTIKRTGSTGRFEGWPGGSINIKIWRSDEQDDSDLIIYCGAYNRSSYFSLPYYDIITVEITDSEDYPTDEEEIY